MSRLSAVLFVLMLAGLGGAASASAATAGGAPGLLQGVACTSATQCTAVETGAGAGIAEVTFNPIAPGRPAGVFLASEDPNSGISRVASGVACPSATQCTLIGYESPALNAPQSAQVSLVATFNPAAPGAAIPVEIPRASDPTFNFASGGIACPATNQCTAVAGQSEVSFNPTAPGSPVLTIVASGNSLRSVACPLTTQCTAVGAAPDGETGTIVTFNPSAPSAATATAAPQHPFVGLACPLTTQCTAADGLTELTFNPMAPATQTQSILNGGNSSNHLFDVQCPSPTQCTAAGFGTTVGTGNGPGQGAIVATFNPAAPGSPTPSPIDSAQQTGIACPLTSECTIIDSQGRELHVQPGGAGHPHAGRHQRPSRLRRRTGGHRGDPGSARERSGSQREGGEHHCDSARRRLHVLGRPAGRRNAGHQLVVPSAGSAARAPQGGEADPGRKRALEVLLRSWQKQAQGQADLRGEATAEARDEGEADLAGQLRTNGVGTGAQEEGLHSQALSARSRTHGRALPRSRTPGRASGGLRAPVAC